MMIDASEQGKGYGKAALEQVLKYIKTKPFGSSDKVTLTCSKENLVAKELYEKMGFAETGAEEDDEIEFSRTV